MPSAIAPLDTITSSRPRAPVPPSAGTSRRWRGIDAAPFVGHQAGADLDDDAMPAAASLTMRAPPAVAASKRGSGVVRHHVAQLRHVLVDGPHQRLAALARERRDLEHRPLPAQRRTKSFTVSRAPRRHHVELVQHQPARLGVQRGVVLLQLGDDRAPAPPDRRPRRKGEVDDMQQQVRALQVAQEQVPQARAFGRTFDQPGMSATTKLCSGPTAPRRGWDAAW